MLASLPSIVALHTIRSNDGLVSISQMGVRPPGFGSRAFSALQGEAVSLG
jgi:hypothetical protein